ncbi:MAG: hypothetical protein H6737_17885 [Alphaproteobacteria bacterium]|nr:hypothetical protein [Alphaproteobacteria bacterium]
MLFDPDRALEALSAVRPSAGPWPAGTPARDHLRSPASQRVGELAARDGLFAFHFEHRFPLDLPEAWVEPGQEELAAAPRWADGVLPEPKYQSFRHDLAIASFHPGHRGKWTSHELCHALVGFAWHPGASRFFHATAGRLAELLPVVLYYFLDEVRLQRCPLHAGGGPLYREFCEACEACAAFRAPSAEDRQHLADAARFLDAELAAVARSRRSGTPIAHRFGSLDLCTDGIAYARSHHRRLDSEAMERFAAFLVPGGGWSEGLDALEARVVEVALALVGGECAPLAPSAVEGRDRWIRQDLAFRMLQVWSETADEAAEGVLALVGALHDRPIGEVVAGWRALTGSFVLPDAEDLFAVGYPLEGLGSHRAQLEEGLQSVVPLSLELGADVGIDLVAPFAAADPAERRPLGDRFADWLAEQHPGLEPLARLETALRSVRADLLGVSLGEEGAEPVLCDGARVLLAPTDLLALSEAVDAGTVSGALEDGRVVVPFEPMPWAMVIGRDGAGELVMVELDPDDARDLLAGRASAGVVEQLVAHGVMRPSRW